MPINFVLVGLNHKTTPVEIRERLAFSEERVIAALHVLKEKFGLLEAMILSTCNRVEVLAHSRNSNPDPIDLTKRFLYEYHALEPPLLEPHFYTFHREDAVRHLFRVASSLDSMVVGEAQILGQLKHAYSLSCEAGSSGKHLNALLHRSFSVAKRVRTETRICNSAVSISYVAVELARKIFGQLDGKSILLVGAGEMAELAARNLMKAGVANVAVANRTAERAADLAEKFGGRPVPFAELAREMLYTDIVVVSTGADSYVLDKPMMQRVIRDRKYSPLFVIDISVPRNVDPAVNSIENVFLYDIDDLKSVVEANLQERQKEAEFAEGIIQEEVQKFRRRASFHDSGALIAQLRGRVEEMCLEELQRYRNTLGEAEYKLLEKILEQTAHKIAHPLIMQIKRPPENAICRRGNIEMIKKAFRLDEEK